MCHRRASTHSYNHYASHSLHISVWKDELQASTYSQALIAGTKNQTQISDLDQFIVPLIQIPCASNFTSMLEVAEFRTMKPKTPVAMKQLISEIRQTLPFGLPESQLCADECKGCSLKLLEFLDIELSEWEERLQQGGVPSLGDIHHVARVSKKIHRVLDRNGILT